MKKLLIIFVALLSWNAMAQTDDLRDELGYVDFGALDNQFGQPKVEINLGKQLLNFVIVLSKKEDPEAAAILEKLKGVRVFVYDMEDATGAVDHIRALQQNLRNDNWVPIVTARDEGEEVNILVKMSDDAIDGLTVMAAGDDDEAVFINIIGTIDPADLAVVTDKLDLDLDQIDIDFD